MAGAVKNRLNPVLAALRITFIRNAVPRRTHSIYQMCKQRHGAITSYLVNLPTSIAYPACERWFPGC
jgi:hypothetical protein